MRGSLLVVQAGSITLPEYEQDGIHRKEPPGEANLASAALDMICVNARFLTQHLTGVQRYAIEIGRALKKLDRSIRFIAPANILHNDVAVELEAETVGRLTGHPWEQLELPTYLQRCGSPLLLALTAAAPIRYRHKVVTVHDLAFRHFPRAVSWRLRLLYSFLIPRVLRTSLHITTVSEFSKRDICATYGIRSEDVSVIPNASSLFSSPSGSRTRKSDVIVAVGSIQPYKNLEALIAGFGIFNQRHQNRYVLKIVGEVDAKVYRRTSLLDAVRGEKGVELIGRLPDNELLSLYESSTCLVFPSLFEGFGIPPLEAMASGCPVIASVAASIPEVCGDAALYCDPHDIDDIANKISHLVENDCLQRQLIEKGYENAKRFSWSRSAAALFDIAKRFERMSSSRGAARM